ncbi:MAG: ABC transporter permease subunit [Candidatus Heimdallarchaeota archaeon]|nr:ABC transporter permease subunit [Candidatus Heimdallarchaeota archaeon]
MQLKVLLKKDLKALFQQKAVLFTLLIPMLLIGAFGLLPALLGAEDPFEISYLNEDVGINGLNLGEAILISMQTFFDQDASLELKEIVTETEFFDAENAFWLPVNFTSVANETNVARYFMIISDTRLGSESVMKGVITKLIEVIVTEELLAPTSIPVIQANQLYAAQDTFEGGKLKDRGALAFPLAYMAFLILMLTSSSIRITGFSAEKQEGMMELILASVKYRRELILSKLITGLSYGIATVFSYFIGILIAKLAASRSENGENAIGALVFATDVLTIKNIILIFLLFVVLTFTSMQILLSAQLLLSKDAGDRLGSTFNFALAFIFYFGLIADPLSETGLLLLNPYFWPFKITLNLAFNEAYVKSFFYGLTSIFFSVILLKIKTRAIEQERVIFE